ncbi:SulP family inorganic anion transporter [Salinarimonas ramus]|uniref:Sodium-independent anion transporter n=1 Tax=Salinarimonas ramus TaxID=690164 RepID=A0A917V1G1_9HYPH|nr:SulP family inorganic anion transporter [Salinarimonas ramus]GGK19265.1 sodium-independent anion transporter [Salinarimonas ramus]
MHGNLKEHGRGRWPEAFTPKLVTVLREGYGGPALARDAIAGLTVAIVALPLSMAIAIASGASPESGLYAAIVGGAIVSALGGSRYQIGGPAGAFIVLVAAIIARHGFDGFLLATMIAGLILIALGALRLGTYIRYIPHPVIVGFTAGIAAIIFVSQLKDLFGITLAGPEPGPVLDKLAALGAAAGTASPLSFAVAAATIAVIVGMKRLKPTAPGMLIAVALAAAATAVLSLPLETIGTRFGGIPNGLPAPALPTVTWERVITVLPDAFAIALLGGIESLLSAVVADGMSGRRHRSNVELVAQGFANIGSALFGGLCVTGTIARTATNVRSGAAGPIAGILHAAFLLGFMLIAAPLASYVPLAALAGVLALVAWNMAEKHEFAAIIRRSRSEAVVLLVTFLVVVFRDLTEGILVGVVLGAFVFMHRMATMVGVEGAEPAGGASPDESETASGRDVMVYRFTGPLFFAASSTVAATLERIGRFPPFVVLDLSAVPLADSSAIQGLASFVARVRMSGASVVVAGARPDLRRFLARAGLKPPIVRYAADVAAARAYAERALAGEPRTDAGGEEDADEGGSRRGA